MDDRALLAHIARSAGSKAGYKQLVRELGLGGGRERRLLLEQLARMVARGDLIESARGIYALPRAASANPGTRDNLIAGRLDLHRDGYGFVRPNPRQPGKDATRARAQDDDVFIPPNEINGAMQGDQVLVELAPPRADGRRLGRIARILTRRNPTVVGTFHFSRGDRLPHHFVVPFDERMTQSVLIRAGDEIPPASEEQSAHRVLGDEARKSAIRHRPMNRAKSGASSTDSGASGTDSSANRPEPLASGTDFSPYARGANEDGALAPAESAHHYDNLEGLIVDVEITSWPTPTRPAIGRVMEILGHPDDFGVDVEMMIRKHQLPRIFPPAVLEEARRVAHLDLAEVARRRDFRGLPIVTIDGETARDFDDAVLVEQRPDGGYELQVHIADVAEYVRPATDLDLEARLRGTSVYFPDRAIPMLPQELSTDICSLRPGEDRLVLSCIMQLDRNANLQSFEIVEGVISSAARMTYTKVHLILEGDEETRREYPELTSDFELMQKLAVLMNQRREERGSIDFDLPEPVIQFDEHGQMRGITRAERTWANRLIEEFMLAANECVATWLEDLGVPSLYRIHEKPDPRRVVQFEELAASFGYSLGLGALPVKRIQTRGDRREAQRSGRRAREVEVPEDIAVTPRMYQRLAKKIEGKAEERILSYLMLRSLQQARYSEINEGHFALAAPTYTHFTSPIRRYPDLIVHRITKALLRAGVSGYGQLTPGRLDSPWTHSNEFDGRSAAARTGRRPLAPPAPLTPLAPLDSSELAQIAEETSQTERRAAEAERELVEWKKVRFMQDRVGEEFAALVLNPTKYGLFVELTDLFVEGLVPIDSLRDDRYTFRENTHEIAGERTGRRFRAGDRVQVILDRILHQERRLQFSIVEEGIPLTGKRKPPPPTKPKKKQKRDQPRSNPSKVRKSFSRGKRR